MIKQYIKRSLYSLLGLSVPNQIINPYKTLIFNFVAFGIKGLIYRPVYIYTNTKIYQVGKIILHCPMKPGILKIGRLDFKSQGITKFSNSGTIELYDAVGIGGACILENYGTIIFKGMNLIGDGCNIFIRHKLELGEQSRIGFHSFVMDSDDHYTIDTETKQIAYNKKAIIIGKYNWIASNTYIKKGTQTPDYLIVASANALLTKDYTALPPYSVVGGSPAKLLKSGIRRIYNAKLEQEINLYFKQNQNAKYFPIAERIDLNEICAEKTM